MAINTLDDLIKLAGDSPKFYATVGGLGSSGCLSQHHDAKAMQKSVSLEPMREQMQYVECTKQIYAIKQNIFAHNV